MVTRLQGSDDGVRILPLSPQQHALWLAQTMTPDVPFVVAQYADLRGSVDTGLMADCMRRALRELDVATDPLVEVEGRPHQVLGLGLFDVASLDLRQESDPAGAARAIMSADYTKPLSVLRDPLVACSIFRLADDRYWWYSRAHHIVLDGYAAMQVMRRTTDLYRCFMTGEEPQGAATTGLADVIEEETRYRTSRRYRIDGDFWRAQAGWLQPQPSLAGAVGRPTAHSWVASAALPEQVSGVLRSLDDRFGAATLIAGFAAFLSRMLDADDLVLGLPVAARTTARLRRGGGSTANVVPLVLAGVGSVEAESAVRICQSAIVNALRHQRFPRYDIVESDNRLVHFGPVVNVMMFRNEIAIAGVHGHVHVLTTGPTTDLSVNIYPGYDDSAWRIDFEANANLYSHETLVNHHRRFLSFLGRFVGGLGSRAMVSDLDLFRAGEHGEFIPATGACGLAPASLPDLLATGLEGHEHSTAVCDDRAALTYKQLDDESNRLARALALGGAGPESLVVIAIPRSIESVVAVWAVAKTGAAFVPVDPTHPPDRVSYMIADSGARFGLTVRGARARLPDSVSWLLVDESEAVGRYSSTPITDADRVAPLRIDHPAYVIYTSGSTGTPKGVVVTHRGLANLAQEIRQKYGIDGSSRILHFASPIFDTSLVEILAASLGAARLVVAPPSTYGGTELHDLLRAHRVTHLLSTPSAVATLDHADDDHLQLVLVGGEPCPPLLARRWAGSRTMRNAYGPTEATCSVTMTEPLKPEGPVSIGHLMRGVSAVVLDEHLRPCPPGKFGDLYLSTPGLARGYHRQAGLTAARFVAAPFAAVGSRMFHTGDIVRFTDDRQLDFHGRRDTQVKIRGFRIELREIDAVLTADPGVHFAATIVHANAEDDRILISYVVPARGAPFDAVHLRRHARNSLPPYMVPASFVEIDTVPLTPTMKLDSTALPPPIFGSQTETGRPPADEIEHELTRIVGDCLHVEVESVEDSFFDLGGDSLSATRVAARINDAFDMQLTVRDIFDAPILATLGERVRERSISSNSLPRLGSLPVPPHIPLAPAQAFIDRSPHEPALYNLPFTIRVHGPLDVEALRRALVDVVDRHAPLRTIYPDAATGVVQRVLDAVEAAPELAVLHSSPATNDVQVEPVLSAPFDVRHDAPIRARLFRLGPDDHVIACAIHHIAADGWSLRPLASDLVAAYMARAAGAEPAWAPLRIDYADYVVWHRARLGDETNPDSVAARQIDYWRSELAGLTAPLELAANRRRPECWTYGAGRVRLTTLSSRLGDSLRDIASRHQTSLYVTVLASVAMLLADLTGRTDIAVGTPIAGRGEDALDELVGMFVNTLVLCVEIEPTMTFDEVIDRARDAHLRGLAQSDVPFERLVQVLDPPRSAVRHPFFQVVVSFDNYSAPTLSVDSLQFDITPHPLDVAKCDLHFHFSETADDVGISCELVYSTDVFDDVEPILERYEKLTSAIVFNFAQ
ncbi:non-ribosomal peptide synthetase [Antrihabitans sp. YC2-6]|uniref:non-ribosomal peptide synthetase n=1 Tax=Antrihabitans sp. YC2-6 TaxID=2799498 RepID=UPI0018F47E47|nr:non-ribosomal peptide synthetase [Antrihabitans sp. YC2-6]MBJ8346972.1 amino acid adenylation domain-containing protein [Antrihabitans sp. YC2-6]